MEASEKQGLRGAGATRSAAPATRPAPELASASGSTAADDSRQGGLQPCAVTDTSMLVADCEMARRALSLAKTGFAEVRWPSYMLQGSSYHVSLLLQPGSAAADGAASRAAASTSGDRPPRSLRFDPIVGHRMLAELKDGNTFNVLAESPADQVVDGATRWDWDVVAKDWGFGTLVLTTTVVIQDSKGNVVRLKPTSQSKDMFVWIWFDGVVEALKDIKVLLGLAAAVLTAWALLRRRWKQRPVGPLAQPEAAPATAKPKRRSARPAAKARLPSTVAAGDHDG
jgi:hypothetical protein